MNFFNDHLTGSDLRSCLQLDEKPKYYFATLASDDFDRSDSDSMGSDWTEESGDFDISSNRAKATAASVASWAGTFNNADADYDIQADGEKQGSVGAIGIIGRFQDTSNYYFLRIHTFSQQLQLRKRVSGSNTTLGSYSGGYSNNTVYEYKMTMVGTALKGYQDAATERISVTDSDITADGVPGMYSDAGDAYNNDFIVTGDEGGAATNTKTFTVDGIVKAQQTKTFTVDGIVKVEQSKTFTVDGIVKEEQTKTFTIDGIVLVQTDKTFTIDGIVLATQTNSFTVDGIVLEQFTKTFTVDGIVLVQQIKTFTVDAIVLATLTKTFTVDGIVKATLTKTFTVDAVILERKTKTFTVDAIIKQQVNKTFTVDAVSTEGAWYTREDKASLPGNDNDLVTEYSESDYDDVALSDNVRVSQTGQGSEFIIHQFRKHNDNNTDIIEISVELQAAYAPANSTVFLQIYNQNSSSWETLDSNNSAAVDTDFTLTGRVSSSLSDYYTSGNWVSFRVYQEVA